MVDSVALATDGGGYLLLGTRKYCYEGEKME
jgi:hypothetical protein